MTRSFFTTAMATAGSCHAFIVAVTILSIAFASSGCGCPCRDAARQSESRKTESGRMRGIVRGVRAEG
jgi:hypothetical protein